MPIKYKIIFFNFMIFLILFDILYLIVWIFSIEMNLVKAVVVAGVTLLVMPWAQSINFEKRKKVVIHNYVVDLYRKFQNRRVN